MKRIFVFVLSVFGFLMGQGAPIQFVPDGVELPPAETTPVASPVPSASVPASVVAPVPESSPASTAAPVSAEPPVSAAAPTPVAPAPEAAPVQQTSVPDSPVTGNVPQSGWSDTPADSWNTPVNAETTNSQPLASQPVATQSTEYKPVASQPVESVSPVPAPASQPVPMFVPDENTAAAPAPRPEPVRYVPSEGVMVPVAAKPAPAPVASQQQAPVMDPWADYERKLDSLEGLSNGLPSMLINSVHGPFISIRAALTLNPFTLYENSNFYHNKVDGNGLVLRSGFDFMMVGGYENEWRFAAGIGALVMVNHNYKNIGYLDAGIMPALQGEAGFPFVGFRQTLAWHLKGTEFVSTVSRTGAYIKSGFLGFEGGYSIITNFGQGPYLSVFFDI